jgi:hypothetical protein
MTNIYRFPWFYEQFERANGLEWLAYMGLGSYWNRDIIVELLVDQIVFESATSDLNRALEYSNICLQTLRDAIIQIITDLENPTYLDAHEYKELKWLHDALVWVMNSAVTARNEDELHRLDKPSEVPKFATMAIRIIAEWELTSPREIRSFEFARHMVEEEWKTWIARLKAMIMGVTLGGLEPSHVYAMSKFIRDPDWVCGSVSTV